MGNTIQGGSLSQLVGTYRAKDPKAKDLEVTQQRDGSVHVQGQFINDVFEKINQGPVTEHFPRTSPIFSLSPHGNIDRTTNVTFRDGKLEKTIEQTEAWDALGLFAPKKKYVEKETLEPGADGKLELHRSRELFAKGLFDRDYKPTTEPGTGNSFDLTQSYEKVS